MPYIIDNITADTVNVTETLKIDGNDVKPYKVYTALLTQTGTDAPVAIVLENTIGDIVYEYFSVGQYNATLNNSFPFNKTVVLVGNSSWQSDCPSTSATLNENEPNLNNVIFITTSGADYEGFYVDGALYRTPIEIRVYN